MQADTLQLAQTLLTSIPYGILGINGQDNPQLTLVPFTIDKNLSTLFAIIPAPLDRLPDGQQSEQKQSCTFLADTRTGNLPAVMSITVTGSMVQLPNDAARDFVLSSFRAEYENLSQFTQRDFQIIKVVIEDIQLTNQDSMKSMF
ncbi:MAG: hypothetical protein ACNI27_14600 [Desulfovibrio sp.]